jgi:hypothetical protein
MRLVLAALVAAAAAATAAAAAAASLPTHVDVLSVGAATSTLLALAGRDAHRYLRLLACGSGGGAASGCTTTLTEAPAAADSDEAGDAAQAALRRLVTAAAAAAAANGTAAAIVVVGVRGDLPPALAGHPALRAAGVAALEGDAYLVRTLALPSGSGGGAVAVTVATGATPRAALYAVYRGLLRPLGARFYLHGDVLPPPDAAATVGARLADASAPGALHVRGAPAFRWRGIQPFHDFPMGPDWWTLDDWRGLQTQLAKTGGNFVGLHTYPLGGPTEPAVFVGAPGSFDPASGAVDPAHAYPSSWYLTQNFSRGNLPGSVSRATGEYAAGAALLFPRDCYGSPAQADVCFPQSPGQAAGVLDAAAGLLRDALAWGRAAAGVGAAVGTEVPLVRPPGAANATLQQLYEGIFGRLVAAGLAGAPDGDGLMYWLWTTEAVEDHSTGKGLPQSNPLWAQVAAEIAVAQAARDAVAPKLALGTNGWCLGPGDNASYLDAAVGGGDASFVLASIDPLLGWAPVDPGYANVTRHAAMAIPWMEDDMGLAGSQLWVGRTLAHAADARTYGAAGLLGLTWRTLETAPQLAALADAGWNESGTGGPPLTPAGVYADFCAAHFGAATADACAALFLSLDGTSDPTSPDMANSVLPRGGQGCCGGPLSAAGQEGPVRFLNTTAFEAWLPTVAGAGNRARAAAWVGQLQYHSALAGASTAAAALATAAAAVHDEASARAVGFPALAAMSWAYTQLLTLLLSYAQSPGELGMLAAHEGMNWPSNFLALAGPILAYTAACAPFDDPVQASCVPDGNWSTGGARTLPHTVTLSSGSNSREWCAAQCAAANYSLAGVEFGVACFCGNALPPGITPLPLAACGAVPCAAAPGEGCGGADILSVYPAACPPAPGLPPNLLPPTSYLGPPRLTPLATAVRTVIGRGEGNVTVQLAVLAAAPPERVSVTWWLVPDGGGGGNTTVAMALVAAGRGLYAAALPLPADPTQALEYVVEAAWPPSAGGAPPAVGPLIWPVEGAQSVVVI